MKSKGFMLILIVSILLLLSGCTDMNLDLGMAGVLKITVHKDLLVDVEFNFSMNTSALNIISMAVTPLDELRSEFENMGYETSTFVKDKKTGIHVIKHYNNLEEVIDVFAYETPYRDQLSIVKDFKISTEDSWFYNTYKINTSFNLIDEFGHYKIMNMIPTDIVLRQVDFKLILDLPIPAENHNASYVYEDGRVLKWDIVPAMNNSISFQIRVPNKDNIIATAVMGIILLLLAVYLFKRSGFSKK